VSRFKEVAIIVFSAFFLHLSLWRPYSFFLCVFLWLVFLFHLVLKKKNTSFARGFFWGIIFYSFHIFPVLLFILKQGYGEGRFLFSVFLIIYCSLHSGAWFFLADKTSRFLGSSVASRVVAWNLWTCVFILWVPQGLLWISGQYIGYPFSFPLLAIAHYPKMLWLLSTLGREGYIFSLVSLQMAIAIFLRSKKKFFFFIIILFALPFFFGFFCLDSCEQVPEDIKNFGHVSGSDLKHPMDAAQDIYSKMERLVEMHPKITHIVMPELSYRFSLNKQKHVLTMWNNNILHDKIQLIIGSSRKEGSEIYNSLYWIQGEKIKRVYDKQILVPFVEYIPKWLAVFPNLKNLFLKTSKVFCRGNNQRVSLQLVDKLFFEPQICADIFLKKQALSDNSFLLLTFNDVIFSRLYNQLLYRFLIIMAIEQKKLLLTVGFESATVISSSGTISNLLSSIC